MMIQSGIKAIFHASSGVQRDNVRPPGFLEATYMRVRSRIEFSGRAFKTKANVDSLYHTQIGIYISEPSNIRHNLIRYKCLK